MRLAPAIALLALVSGFAADAAAAPDLVRTLPNKITLIVREVQTRPIVSLQAWVRAGTRDERATERGVAALTAQCIGDATPRFESGEMAKNVGTLGGKFVKDAAYEFAYFDLSLPSRSLNQGLDLLFESIAHAKVDAVTLASAKSHEVNRSAGMLGSAERAAVSSMLADLHPGNALGAPLGMPENEINLATIPLVERFYKEHYVAENLTIMVSGDVDAQEVAGKVEAAFKDMPRGRAGSRSKLSERALSGPRTMVRGTPEGVKGAAVAIGFRGPAWDTSDALAVDVLMALLVDGAASRTQRIFDSGNAAFLNSAAIRQFEIDGGSVTLSLLCHPDSLDDAEDELLKIVEQARSTPIQSDEFEMAVSAVLQRDLFSRIDQTGVGRATAVAVLRGMPGGDEVHVQRLKALRPEDLIAVARKYLDVKRSVFLEMLPDGAARMRRGSELERRIQEKQAVFEAAFRTGPQVTASTDADRSARMDAPLKTISTAPLQLGRGRVARAVLPGGTRLLTSEDRSSSIVTIAFYLMGGVRYENDLNNGVTSLVREAILNTDDPQEKGLTYRQKLQLMGRLASFQDKDMWGCVVSVPTDRWQDAARRMGAMFSHPDLDTVNVGATRLSLLESLDRWLHDDGAQRQRLIFPTKYQVSGYRLPGLGSYRTLATIPHPDVRAWYDKFVVGQNLVVCVFGDVSAQAAQAQIEEAVRDIPSRPFTPGPVAREGEFEGFREKWELGSGDVHSVSLAFNGPPAKSPDLAPLHVVSALLSGPRGWFDEYIMKSGGAMFAGSIVSQAYDESPLICSIQVNDPQQEEDMVKLVFRQVKKASLVPLKNDLAPDLVNAKALAVGSYLMQLDTNPTRAFQYGRSELFGLGVDYPILFPAKIDAVTAEDLQRIGQIYFLRGQFAWAPYAICETRPGGW